MHVLPENSKVSKTKKLNGCKTRRLGANNAYGFIKWMGHTIGRCEDIREVTTKCRGRTKRDPWNSGQQFCGGISKHTGCSAERAVVNKCSKKKGKRRHYRREGEDEDIVDENFEIDPELAEDEEWEYEITVWILPEMNVEIHATDADGLEVNAEPVEEDSLIIQDFVILALNDPDSEMSIEIQALTGSSEMEGAEDTTEHWSGDDNTVVILAAALGAVALTGLIMAFTCYHYSIGCFRKTSKSLMPVPVHSHELDDVMMSSPTASGFAFEGEQPADYTIQPWHLQQQN